MTPENRKAIIEYRCTKAIGLLKEIDLLLNNSLFNSAVNRMYYACFHAVSALMIKYEIEVHSHAGIRQLFGLHFVKSGIIKKEDARIFSRIYDKRQASDYDDFIDFSMEEVMQFYPEVCRFVHQINSLIDS